MIHMKRCALALALIGCVLMLAGCGNLFDREYLSITDYEPPVQEAPADEDVVTVRNLRELRKAVTELLDNGAEQGRVVFDAAYDGEMSDDLAGVCWQVRTQDALFAYCVESISYDLTKLVTHYEARFTIRYSVAGQDRDSIVRLQLTNGLERQLREAILRGDEKLVVVISRSSLSAEDVARMVSRVYRADPIAQPREPRVTVNMLSGTGQQRLYEINFNYLLSAEDLAERRSALQALDPFAEEEALPEDAPHRALFACEYLLDHSSFAESGQSDIYSALVLGEAGSEGLALAYLDLCGRLNVPCQIVYGQRDWQSCCWNIIHLDGAYYHVDVSACMIDGMEAGFLLPDETMWSRYRWDISSYPPCDGRLRYLDLLPEPEQAPAPEPSAREETGEEDGEPQESPEP